MSNVKTIEWDETETEIRLRCSCHLESLSVTGFLDGDEDELLYLSIADMASRGKMRYWNRIKYIWKIIRTGEAWEDQMVLRLEDAEEFGALLQQLVKRMREAATQNVTDKKEKS